MTKKGLIFTSGLLTCVSFLSLASITYSWFKANREQSPIIDSIEVQNTFSLKEEYYTNRFNTNASSDFTEARLDEYDIYISSYNVDNRLILILSWQSEEVETYSKVAVDFSKDQTVVDDPNAFQYCLSTVARVRSANISQTELNALGWSDFLTRSSLFSDLSNYMDNNYEEEGNLSQGEFSLNATIDKTSIEDQYLLLDFDYDEALMVDFYANHVVAADNALDHTYTFNYDFDIKVGLAA